MLNYHLDLSRATQRRVLSVKRSPQRQTESFIFHFPKIFRASGETNDEKTQTLLLGFRPAELRSLTHPDLHRRYFGDVSAALETNLRLDSHFPVKKLKLGLLKNYQRKKDRTASPHGSGPLK